MSIIYTQTKSDTDSRTDIDVGDGRLLMVNITHEGIIMDVWKKADDVDEIGSACSCDEHLGTVGMTFDEWADDIVANDVVTMIGMGVKG